MPNFPQYQNAGLVQNANFVAKTAAYTANNGDFVLVTNSTNAITITLPPVAQGGPVTVKKVDSGTGATTVKTSDSSTLDGIAGATGIVLAKQYDTVTLVSDGSNWWTASINLNTAASPQ